MKKESILKIGFGVLLTIFSVLSGIASILAWVGVKISQGIVFGIIALFFGGVLIWMLVSYIRNLKKIILEKNNELQEIKSCEMNINLISNINEIPNIYTGNVRSIHIISSGTETYYNLLAVMLNKEIIQRGIKVDILFRIGTDEKRIGKLLQYDHKWEELARKYDLNIKYYPIDNFIFNLRGIVFDDIEGYIGFYYRRNGETYGGEEEVLHVNTANAVGNYLIRHFLDRFKNIHQYDSIKDIVDKNK